MSDRIVKVIKGTEGDFKWVEVDGWSARVPGLVINEAGLCGWYVITHLRSGRCLGSFVWPSIAAARRAAKKLDEIEDWDDHVGFRGSITGRLLKQVIAICKEEGRHRAKVGGAE